jgi:hypothetical protein
MKYIEEIYSGDCFIIDNKPYLLTTDFKSNGCKLAFSLENGCPRWVKNKDIIEIMPVYRLDIDNNIIPLKETKKDDYNLSKNTNIS